MNRLVELVERAVTRALFDIRLRVLRRKGMLSLWHLIALGNDYAVVDGRVMVIVTKPHVRIIGK